VRTRRDGCPCAARVNLHGPIATIATARPAPLAQGRGAIRLVASVAGYRGLPKAFIYGASKAALIDFAETLYFDLHPRGLGLYLIMPGFVRTPLTERNAFAMPHLISADAAAQAMLRGLRAGAFENRLSARVHAAVEDPAPAALPTVLRSREARHRPLHEGFNNQSACNHGITRAISEIPFPTSNAAITRRKLLPDSR
jgi:NAD(P)-dependent dehydrogenase (short-subunit alcohol dehydrogenase family)